MGRGEVREGKPVLPFFALVFLILPCALFVILVIAFWLLVGADAYFTYPYGWRRDRSTISFGLLYGDYFAFVFIV